MEGDKRFDHQAIRCILHFNTKRLYFYLIKKNVRINFINCILHLVKQAATWIKDFDGNVSTTDSNVLLEKDKIKLRRNHFCWWAFIGRCTLEVQIRPYIQNDLLQTDTVTLKVFAIKACDVKVSILHDLWCQTPFYSQPMTLKVFVIKACDVKVSIFVT